MKNLVTTTPSEKFFIFLAGAQGRVARSFTGPRPDALAREEMARAGLDAVAGAVFCIRLG